MSDEPNVEENSDGTMTVRPNGRWEWLGIYVPSGYNDPTEQSEFVVFADNMTEAVKLGTETLPEESDIVYLARGQDVSGKSTTISKEAADQLRESMKRSVN